VQKASCEAANQIPVILKPSDWPTWLEMVQNDPKTLLRPSGEMHWRVSGRANGVELFETIG
jgi:putative SOS response-associated peptidase YedK